MTTTPTPTAALALTDAIRTLMVVAAIRNEPSRADVILNRSTLAGTTDVRAYLNGSLAYNQQVPFDPAELRLHLHVLDSGAADEVRTHAWMLNVTDLDGAPPAVTEHITDLARKYHRPHRGCEDCGAIRPLPGAQQWTIVVDEYGEIAQVRAGLLTALDEAALRDAGHVAAFVLRAHSLPSAYARAIKVLDDLYQDGVDLIHNQFVEHAVRLAASRER
ncbi:hypothetical protein [Kitasatospora cheerisanensis]|uniref:Uncharacterized protein n=1 Tax=Kitasatospora cheerisanensis KCTC 2395 TaxID=1348663 RepID=A0A066Z6D7_9ACTN|nr:hypothetical protein [Kitasatospora cheerisanensis]KDN85695.1 hypothetical protein KCH_25230 [Kitasatospora cheerisanensis KCTC 2395]